MLKIFAHNTLKSFTVLFLGCIVFISVITIFPLIGSITMGNFPLQQIIKDNFKLLIPLFVLSIGVSPLFGWFTYKLKKKRIVYLFLIGLIGCELAIVLVLLIKSNFAILKEDIGLLIILSGWALVAYSFFSFPILLPVILIIEKWTRCQRQEKKIENNERKNGDNIQEFVFDNLHFKYDANWHVTKEILRDGIIHQINCIKKDFFSSDSFVISQLKIKSEPIKMIQYAIEEMEKGRIYGNMVVDEIKNSNFKNFPSYVVNIETRILTEEPLYCNITSFNIENNTILIFKQSASKESLYSDFKLMEESLVMEKI